MPQPKLFHYFHTENDNTAFYEVTCESAEEAASMLQYELNITAPVDLIREFTKPIREVIDHATQQST